ncbi:amidase [Nocardioides sp. AE5]|uniref:amidase n=1 Tax=Nocardioides sp. AE5 TaxID=2962573 RepID=UPI002882676C|nr:amidase [Nocardioides sp. AE5]MDT0200734.1 amidase [Nocardioides sp. AE5]
MTRVHSFADDALGDHDTVGLVEQLRAGNISPAEVVEAAITRIEAVNPAVNAVAHPAYDAARAEAAAPRGGFFSGIPTLVKDNADVAAMPTQHGSDAFVAKPPKADGDFARMYRATGLVVLGKSQLSEWGFSASAEHARLGAVRNPWDTDFTAGASSAGSAALVAAGALPIAHANDGGGSIRIPAASTGLVGLKPTRNRLAQDKLMRDMPVRIVADGVLTRSVRDTAAFYREAEKVYRNLKLAPIGDITRPGKKRLKIAFTTESVGRVASPEMAGATRATAALLEELGHQVEEITPPVPDYFADDFLLYWSLLAFFIVRTGRRTHGKTWDKAQLDNLTRGLDRHCARNLYRLPLAIARVAASGKVSARFHKQYDVVLTPTVAHTTPQVGHLDPTNSYEEIIERLMDWVAFTPLQNATGDPAISLPLAITSTGMPIGMMFGAGRGREATLLELALELEEARPFARIQGA